MNVAVYCGANEGNNPEYKAQAVALGLWIGQNGHRLVYGGGHYGMMGAVADAVLSCGGEVTGVTPDFFIEHELIHPDITELIKVTDMADRRSKMIELSDLFIALPGGVGTLDEISEVMTYNRLKQFVGESRPTVLFNTNDYYRHLVEFLETMVAEGYYDQEDLDEMIVAASVEELEAALKHSHSHLLEK